MFFAAQDAAPTVAVPLWLQIVGAIVAAAVAAAGGLASLRAAQKSRLESIKLQRELRDEVPGDESSDIPTRMEVHETSSSPAEALAAGTQDFVVRFILLVVALEGYSLIQVAFSTVFSAILSAISFGATGTPATDMVLAAGSPLIFLFLSLGRWLVFLAVGVPLLRDVLRSTDLTPRDLVRRRPR